MLRLVLSQGSTWHICWKAEDEYDVQLWGMYGRKIHEDNVSVVMWGRALVGAVRRGRMVGGAEAKEVSLHVDVPIRSSQAQVAAHQAASPGSVARGNGLS